MVSCTYIIYIHVFKFPQGLIVPPVIPVNESLVNKTNLERWKYENL